jgi:hypothetical protein
LNFENIKTVDDLIRQWDSGGIIWSIELGGLGPGYEQAIQAAAVELARVGKDCVGDVDEFNKRADRRLAEISDDLLGLTGAQSAVAKWLAWQWCNEGPAAISEKAKGEGRSIMVSRSFPRAPEPPQ